MLKRGCIAKQKPACTMSDATVTVAVWAAPLPGPLRDLRCRYAANGV